MFKNYKILTILLLFIAIHKYSSQSSAETNQVCKKCNCYKIKCTRLESPDENCQDTFKGSCDNKDNIVKENDCNSQCDCCLEGNCYLWSDYYCIIYRSFEFSTVWYFILISFNLFILVKVNSFLFNVKSKKIDNIDTIKKDKIKIHQKEKFSIKYTGFKIIKKSNDSNFNISTDKSKIVKKLFDEIESLKSIGVKNIIQIIILGSIYISLDLIHFLFIFTMSQRPLLYGKVCWVQHSLLMIFYVLTWLIFKKVEVYGSKIRHLLGNYEKNYKCKIKINQVKKVIEFNFDDRVQIKNQEDFEDLKKGIKIGI